LARINVAEFQVPVDYALPMCLRQARADLARDPQGFLRRKWAAALDSVGQRLAFDKLHREKVHFPGMGSDCMKIVDLADVVMADLARRARLRRKAFSVSPFGKKTRSY
jgi:hypothetical protein